VKGYGSAAGGNYALFGVMGGVVKGTSTTINGDVGTDGTLDFSGKPTVTGSVNFDGPGSNWLSAPGATYTVNYNAAAVTWPTVDSLANSAFPGGLSYLATNNDNGLASPAIAGNSVSLTGHSTQTFVGKSGGANYYLTMLSCGGSSSVSFDNSLGPITIWIGPSGGSGTFDLAGGAATIKQSTDPTRPVKIYIATSSGSAMHGNSELDAQVYAYNGSSSGTFTLGGTPDIYGSIIAYAFLLNGDPTIHYESGYTTSSSSAPGYYGFDDSWQEQNIR
jgi:hypothetical protein